MIYFPNFLENCLILDQQCPEIFPKSFSTFILEKKNQIDLFFEECHGDCILMISNLEKGFKRLGKDDIPRDFAYFETTNEFLKNFLYHNINENNQKPDFSRTIEEIQKDGKWKCSNKLDFFDELYSDNEFNFYVKILYSAAFRYMMNDSLFKQFTERALVKSNMEFKKNVVDFPFYVDFIVTHNEKTKYIIVIYFREKKKKI
jgi:hypothetical protein